MTPVKETPATAKLHYLKQDETNLEKSNVTHTDHSADCGWKHNLKIVAFYLVVKAFPFVNKASIVPKMWAAHRDFLLDTWL